jgi:hypothetical protein
VDVRCLSAELRRFIISSTKIWIPKAHAQRQKIEAIFRKRWQELELQQLSQKKRWNMKISRIFSQQFLFGANYQA